jgi:hypothetical protein
MLSFFVSFSFSFFKLNPKSQTNVDEHGQEILVTLAFVWPYPKDKKIETLSIIHKQTKKLNKRTKK